MKPPTITPELKKAVTLALALQAFEEKITPTVQAYQQEIIDRYQWHIDQRWTIGNGRHLPDEVITCPSHTFLLSDEDAAVYYAELEQAKAANGWGHIPKNHCPLAMVQNRRVQAENALMQAAQYITTIDPAGVYDMDMRRQLIDLITGLVVSLDEINPHEGMTLFAIHHNDLPPRKVQKSDEDREKEAIAFGLYARLYNEFGVIDQGGAIAIAIASATGITLDAIIAILQGAINEATA